MSETNKIAILAQVYSHNLYENDLEEAYGLVNSAGYILHDVITQNIKTPSPRFFIGRGKAFQIQQYFMEFFKDDSRTLEAIEIEAEPDELDLDLSPSIETPEELTIIFNNKLNSTQKMILSRVWPVRVIDRDDLILEIFEQNARSRENILQISLARLKFQMHVVKAEFGEHLDEKAGRDFKGKGVVGWEPKKEAYRRRQRLIEQELEIISQQRSLQRKNRIRFFNVGVIGYTNAGKSTLLNLLTNSKLATADEEFTTVETRSRSFTIPHYDDNGNWDGIKMVLTDSVGFVENMSNIVKDAFLSTLEEVTFSDMLLLIIDISDKDNKKLVKKINTTTDIIDDIGVHHLPSFFVFNKIDLLTPEELERKLEFIKQRFPKMNFITISAQNKSNIEELKENLIQFKKQCKRRIK